MGISTFQNNTGSFAIVDTGSACLPPRSDSFNLEVADLTFIFIFKNDNSKDGTKIEEVSRTEKSLSIALVNFDNSLGTAWSSRVGGYNNKDLYMSLFISSVGETDPYRNITYSFFTKEDAI